MQFFLRGAKGIRPLVSGRLTFSSGLVSTFVAAALLASGPSAHAAKPPRHHEALVRVSTARLRSEPGTKAKATALLDAGRSAKVIAKKKGWTKLRLDSGREGWVRADLVDVSKATVRDHDSQAPSHHKSKSDDAPVARNHKHQGDTAHEATLAARKRAEAQHQAALHRQHVEEAHQAALHKKHVEEAHQSALAAIRHKMEARKAAAALAQAHAAKSHPAPKTVIAARPPQALVQVASAEVKDASDDTTPQTDTDTSAQTEAGNSRSDRLIRSALSYRGTPYRMGATGNGAFDCSGFTRYLFSKEGTAIPRTAAEQYEHGTPVDRENMQPGDLVFFKNTYKHGVSHVGIYIGNDSFVHASSGHGRGVTVSSLNDAYYRNHWAGARRAH